MRLNDCLLGPHIIAGPRAPLCTLSKCCGPVSMDFTGMRQKMPHQVSPNIENNVHRFFMVSSVATPKKTHFTISQANLSSS